MLARRHRVTRSLFDSTMRQGKILHSTHFSLRICPLSEQSRFAFVVSGKVSGKAVVRNLLRRRAQTVARELLDTAKQPVLAVLYFKKGADKLSFDELRQEITSLYIKK